MAEKLTDGELAAELKRYGDNVKVPIDRKRRQILMKKLNHYRAKEKVATQPKKETTSRRKQNAEFSSEESEEEVVASSAVSRVLNRPSVRNTSTPFYSNTDTIEISPPRTRQNTRNRKSLANATASSSKSKTPSLYPDLSSVKLLDHSSVGNRSKDDGPGHEFGDGEFTDSDPEESIYVENKSMNTTFTLQENLDNEDSYISVRPPSSSRVRSSLRNRLSGSPAQKITGISVLYNHSTYSSLKEDKCSKDNNIESKENFKTAKASCISTGILILLGIFFIAVASAYFYMGSTHDIDNTKYPACQDDQLCDDMKRNGKVIARMYEDKLKEAAVNDNGPKMVKIDVLQNELARDHTEVSTEQKKFALEMIILNPEWNIRVLDAKFKKTDNASNVTFLETDPDLGFMTRLHLSIHKVLFGFLLLFGCLFLTAIVIFILKYRHGKLEEEQQKVFNLVEKIIVVIKENYEFHQEDSRRPPYMAVSHVRDQLLPLKERQKLRPLWDKAVQFIETNESRIRIETQAIQGEDFLVWRWLPSNSNGGKVWQGQAFGENSTLPYGPTPCLKIRNMFDADMETGKDWEVSVQDALLEKCKLINGIVHIHVDPSSKEGCVYMKCNSCDTAFLVYKSLHGWWFDGRLVTVKYLRADNYHNKFPESRRATKSLKPSNSSMSSLAQPYHQSTLEMT